jgi:quercetin dioxygenase-like cupin family protein
MNESGQAEATVVEVSEPLWFLGILVRVLLDGKMTGGQFALIDATLPMGAAPPLHSHPQGETFYILDGVVTMWIDEQERKSRAGAVGFAPGGSAHTWRVESDTARMLILSTPAGIEDYIRALSEPAAWPWLQSPPEAPRIPAERIEEAERRFGVVRHGPPPEPA